MPEQDKAGTRAGREWHDAHARSPVYLTPRIAPVGGRLKARPEDFLVEELPQYEPSGTGEHLYLFVEKRNLSTMELVNLLARHFKVGREAVGYAGLKDKVAVTRQVLSVHVPGRKPADLPSFEHERARVLWASMHGNKLRRGHLKGNRFVIRIRETEPSRVVQATMVLRELERSGVPNRAGEQRFGYLANNHLVGRALLLGRYDEALDHLLGPSPIHPEYQAESRRAYAAGDYGTAHALMPAHQRTETLVLAQLARGVAREKAVRAIDLTQRRFVISAFQSAVFNAVLDQRLLAGELGVLREGDLAWKHGNGAVFSVQGDEVEALRERLTALEISPSGPMWGLGMTTGTGKTGEAELEALHASGVTLRDIEAFSLATRDKISGARRPLRVPVAFPDCEGGVDEHGAYIKCTFELPRGAFATVVMHEIMKPDPERRPEPDAGDDANEHEQES